MFPARMVLTSCEGRQKSDYRAGVVTQLHRDLRLHDHLTLVAQGPLGSVLEQPLGREEAGQGGVDAELLLNLGRVEPDLPAQRLSLPGEDLAAPDEESGHAAHGVITILSASRRS
jgi:hypothetical protein